MFPNARQATSCRSWTSQSESTTTISLVRDIMWAPQTACITFWACFGYFLSIATIAQLWKPPASGRW